MQDNEIGEDIVNLPNTPKAQRVMMQINATAKTMSTVLHFLSALLRPSIRMISAFIGSWNLRIDTKTGLKNVTKELHSNKY